MNSTVRGLTILWKSCKIHRSSRIVLSEESWSADSLKIGKLWRVLQRILDGGAGGGLRDMGGVVLRGLMDVHLLTLVHNQV